jgi:hypothetical protein
MRQDGQARPLETDIVKHGGERLVLRLAAGDNRNLNAVIAARLEVFEDGSMCDRDRWPSEKHIEADFHPLAPCSAP